MKTPLGQHGGDSLKMCCLSDRGVSLVHKETPKGWTGDSASQNSADGGSVALQALLFPSQIGEWRELQNQRCGAW